MLRPTSILDTGTTDGSPTVRRYPRTLDEAFPKTTSYGNAITHYPRSENGWIVKIAVYLIVYSLAGLIIYSYLTK
jgi:hypothetical protein